MLEDSIRLDKSTILRVEGGVEGRTRPWMDREKGKKKQEEKQRGNNHFMQTQRLKGWFPRFVLMTQGWLRLSFSGFIISHKALLSLFLPCGTSAIKLRHQNVRNHSASFLTYYFSHVCTRLLFFFVFSLPCTCSSSVHYFLFIIRCHIDIICRN